MHIKTTSITYINERNYGNLHKTNSTSLEPYTIFNNICVFVKLWLIKKYFFNKQTPNNDKYHFKNI